MINLGGGRIRDGGSWWFFIFRRHGWIVNEIFMIRLEEVLCNKGIVINNEFEM
jgi:hypothetical protein